MGCRKPELGQNYARISYHRLLRGAGEGAGNAGNDVQATTYLRNPFVVACRPMHYFHPPTLTTVPPAHPLPKVPAECPSSLQRWKPWPLEGAMVYSGGLP